MPRHFAGYLVFGLMFLRFEIIPAKSLVKAIQRQNVELIKRLVNKATANKASKSGRLPLTEAVREGNLDVVSILVEAGASLNPLGSRDDSPLMAACLKNRADIAKYLIENGANIDEMHGYNDILAISCMCVSFRVANYLTRLKWWDVNQPGMLGNTPFMNACKYDTDLALYMLEERGADVNSANFAGETPLFNAAWDRTGRLAARLIEKGASVNERSVVENSTPLYSAISECNIAMMEVLIGNGADVNAKSNMWHAPLEVATFCVRPRDYARLEPVRLLLEAGANSDFLTFRGVKFMDATIEGIVTTARKMIFYKMPLLEVFLRAGIRIGCWGQIMEQMGATLHPGEYFEEYFGRLASTVETSYVVVPGELGSVLTFLEWEGFHSLWYVAKNYFEMERKVKVQDRFQGVFEAKLIEIYYEERRDIFGDTFLGTLPMDIIRSLWVEFLNPKIRGKIRRRTYTVNVLCALEWIDDVVLNYSTPNADIKPFIEDLFSEFIPATR